MPTDTIGAPARPWVVCTNHWGQITRGGGPGGLEPPLGYSATNLYIIRCGACTLYCTHHRYHQFLRSTAHVDWTSTLHEKTPSDLLSSSLIRRACPRHDEEAIQARKKLRNFGQCEAKNGAVALFIFTKLYQFNIKQMEMCSLFKPPCIISLPIVRLSVKSYRILSFLL